ncbi:MAG TPA: glutamine--fructose-6-phosphate transaminase (isomerizing) [Burkholderiales bacterium]|jgi:glucosamine--fructose-6-phosphate aminotransferase (isomerizing)|nr:glutamine--fructose-6-phosphate transaminase (isomerizing) [Burkholderiales bacterium]
MCGIVGAVARRDVVPVLIEGLKRLEYRGYDSAGVAVLDGANPLPKRVRASGRVAELEKRALEEGLAGTVGVAHTRWATHGAPCERNAHPHVSGGISVVHNGIIENHEEIRARLLAAGYAFDSDTDTEVIAHLIHFHRCAEPTLFDAVRKAAGELTGAYAIAVISAGDPCRLVVARHGAPLLLGVGEGEHFAASDSSALVQVTRRVVFLEDGDCAEIGGEAIRIVDGEGYAAERPETQSQLSADAVELGAHRHYMQKEIFEQPEAIAETLEAAESGLLSPELFGSAAAATLASVDSVLVLACGTSFHAGLVARYWIESLAGLPCNVEIASEYRYRESVANPNALIVAISQSGETADTLAALEHARSLGQSRCLAICNVPESALVRASSLRFLTRAGPEIGVASTKAFTTQLAALFLLSVVLGKLRRRISEEKEQLLLAALRRLPAELLQVLRVEREIEDWAKAFARHEHALFLGRGIHYPIAMEGALKLKEISYIHAEAYAAGELKHGPLALVDERMPVVAIAPKDALFEKLKSNLQEVRARGGELYVLADHDARLAKAEGVNLIRLPAGGGPLSPVLHTLPLQLLAYHAALARGNDVDKPRNLAKSVTVE